MFAPSLNAQALCDCSFSLLVATLHHWILCLPSGSWRSVML